VQRSLLIQKDHFSYSIQIYRKAIQCIFGVKIVSIHRDFHSFIHHVNKITCVITIDQNLSLQKDALINAGCEKIFEDVISGAKPKSPGLSEIINYTRKGDSIIVWRLDRLDRSLKDLINKY
jgi:hypothetical protein